MDQQEHQKPGDPPDSEATPAAQTTQAENLSPEADPESEAAAATSITETERAPEAAEPDSGADPSADTESEAAVAAAITGPETGTAAAETLSVDELLQTQAAEEPVAPAPQEDIQIKAVLEAIIYVAEEPLTTAQIASALQEPEDRIRTILDQLIDEFEQAGHGVCIRVIAGGYKMATKPEHHDAVRNFVKSLKPPLKLSLPALETLAVIAYKQPVTGPEIMEIRGVQGGGVLKTLLDRKLIAAAGRKNVIGKPILYKTTKEFLIQFGLKDLSELPSLKEFEEIRRMAFDSDTPAAPPAPSPEPEVAPLSEPEAAPGASQEE